MKWFRNQASNFRDYPSSKMIDYGAPTSASNAMRNFVLV